MAKYITEILADINNKPETISQYADNYAIKTILQYAFDTNLKFALPEGEPPFKRDPAPLGMSPANFYQQVKKLYLFTRTDLSRLKLESLFIQLIEGLHPSEADVCVAIKDQILTKLYPAITPSVVVAAGFVTSDRVIQTKELSFRSQAVEQVAAQETTGRALVLDLSESVGLKESMGDAPPPNEPPASMEQPAKRGRGRPKKIA